MELEQTTCRRCGVAGVWSDFLGFGIVKPDGTVRSHTDSECLERLVNEVRTLRKGPAKIILAGTWQCASCQKRYRVRHTPGVLTREPRDLPEHVCPSCGGNIEPADDDARKTEERVREEAAYWEQLTAEFTADDND